MNATLRKAKQRGQTFNSLIRKYNAGERTLLDSVPSLFEGFSGEVHPGRACTACHEIDCVPVEHRFLCVPCRKEAGAMTDALGTDDWIYGMTETDRFYNPDVVISRSLDDETMELLAELDVEIDLEVALADEPPY